MVSHQILVLFQRSKTTAHLLQLRSLIYKTGLDRDEYCVSQFILSACPVSIDFARSVFESLQIIPPPLFAWNTIIRFYAESPNPKESLSLFSRLQRSGLKPDKFTYPSALKACGRSSKIGVGGAVHSSVVKAGFDSDKYILNTLLRMYAACGSIGLARRVFDEMTQRDVVSWSSMIAGYVSCNCSMDALLVFGKMRLVNVKPTFVTLVSLLTACTHLTNTRLGECIHSFVVVNSIGLNVELGTALLEMYSKCGHIDKALHVFNSMSEKNLQSWTVMISGLADHSRGKDAISMFNQMVDTGLNPDSLSFSVILSACSHLGLVDEGWRYFCLMTRIYDIGPRVEHYGCMVDLFGRAGLVEEAYEIIKSMPVEPSSAILRSFLGACKSHGRLPCMDDNFRNLLLKIEPYLGANYVLAANVFSFSGFWNDSADVRVSMEERGLKKIPGYSRVEVSGASGAECLKQRLVA